ncbi:MAG: alpha/beta hydrolase [Lachnospiraceae bacterium]|nr:alpha/beta hydrolase [Lachnospiraceae bacterium]
MILYNCIEKACFIMKRLPGGGIKVFDMGEWEAFSKQERLPGFLNRNGLRTRSKIFRGFRIHRISDCRGRRKTKKVVLFLPGGGGMQRATILHYDTAARIVKGTGADVYIAAYPLAPEYNVRDALLWLEKVYAALLKKHDPKDIIFIGDSAGANLILSLTYRLKEKPGKLIVISPACGLENGKTRDIRLAMEPYDPILTVEMNDMIAANWCRNVPLDSPDISPEYIDYNDFPPMFFFYGEHEIFYPLVYAYLCMLREKGVFFQENKQPMCHDWALCSFLREGRRAIRTMCGLITE